MVCLESGFMAPVQPWYTRVHLHAQHSWPSAWTNSNPDLSHGDLSHLIHCWTVQLDHPHQKNFIKALVALTEFWILQYQEASHPWLELFCQSHSDLLVFLEVSTARYSSSIFFYCCCPSRIWKKRCETIKYIYKWQHGYNPATRRAVAFPLACAFPDACVCSMPTPSWILLFAPNLLRFSISTCLCLITVKNALRAIYHLYHVKCVVRWHWVHPSRLCSHQRRPPPELFPACKSKTLYPLNGSSPFPRLPTLLDNHHASFHVCDFDDAQCVIYMKSYRCLFVSVWFHLASGPQGSSWWSRCQSFLPVWGRIILHRKDGSHFICSSVDGSIIISREYVILHHAVEA